MVTRRPSSAGGKISSSGWRSAVAIASGSGMFCGSLHTWEISSVPALVVSRIRVFLKSITRPSPSSITPLSNTWKKISCTSGWAFSTSSSNTTL
ncbi:hypothetical protein D3C76_1451870 [compost metagenome]